MAGTSFKVQCPSCEAMVPVRDPGLIGRKIDCPKCKYRFVVEEPDSEEDDKPAAKKKDAKGPDKATKANDKGGKTPVKAGSGGPRGREDEDKPSKMKKTEGGGNNIVILGGVLAAVAIVAIVAGAWGLGLFGGSSSPSPSSSPGPMAGGSPTGVPAAGQENSEQGNNPNPNPEQGAQPGANDPVVLVNITNLLPRETEAVISYPMRFTLGSSLTAAAMHEAEGGFRPERFRQRFGISPEDINAVVTALNSRENWVFSVLQTKKPFNRDLVKKELRLIPQPPLKSKSEKSYEWFLLGGDLDSLGNLLLKFNQHRENFAVHFLDNATMVFADPAPMRRFLEQDGKPDYQTKDPAQGGEVAAGPATGSPGMGPMGSAGGPTGPPPSAAGAGPIGDGPSAGAGPMAGGPPGGMGPMGYGPGYPGMPGAAGAGGGDDASPPPPSSYMTVDPVLKLVMDRLEKIYEEPQTRKKVRASVFTIAALRSWNESIFRTVSNQLTQLQPAILPLLELPAVKRFQESPVVGLSLHNFNQSNATVYAAMAGRNRQDAAAAEKVYSPLITLALPLFKSGLDLNVTQENPPAAGGGAVGGYPGMMYPGGYPGGSGPPPGMTMGGPRGGGPPPGMTMGGPRGGGPPPGMTMGGPGSGGPRGGRPGGSGEGIPGGAGGITGGYPGAPGGGTGEEEAPRQDGTLGLVVEDTLLVCKLELQLTPEAYEKIIGPTREAMQWVKSQSELSSPRARYHDLGRALVTYVNDKGQFPPGLLPRPMAPDRGMPWRPDQRLSWVVELLPYLGDEYREWVIDRDKGWNEGRNAFVASRTVAPLLAHRMANLSPPQIIYPAMPEYPVGATHFVAVAGLGLDAAEYTLNDANHAAKLGLFGYNRVVRRADVKDGLDKTIAFLLVPGDHRAPWIAGGGATLRGVPDENEESNPLAGFVCMTHEGKRGTLAIMADGTVRFLPEKLDPAVFRGLCTIAGGEQLPDKLDKLCPRMPDVEEPRLSTPGSLPSGPSAGIPGGIEGMWRFEKVEVGGVAAPVATLAGQSMMVSGNTLTFVGGSPERYNIKLDNNKSPRTIDLEGVDGPNKGKTLLGIYEINGNQLKLCYAGAGSSQRPEKFASPLLTSTRNLVLQRTGGAGGSSGPMVLAPAKIDWRDYTPASGAFTVRMPGPAREMKQEVPLPTGGKLTMVIHLAQLGGTDGGCVVMMQDMPGPVPPAQAFEGGKAGFLRSVPGGKLISEKEITLDKNPGREWVVSMPGQGNSKARVYLVGTRLFVLMAGPEKIIGEKDADIFLNSFKLGK